MTRKVTLDLLDIEEPTISPTEEHPDEDTSDENRSGKSPRTWYRSRLFLISGAALLVICCAGFFLFFFRGAKKEARHLPAPEQAVVVPTAPASGQAVSPPPDHAHSTASAAGAAAPGEAKDAAPSRIIPVEMKDFLIPLKYDGKDHEVLVIDVTVQIDSSQQELFNAKLVIVRGGIYSALHDIAADIPKGKGGMGKVREKVVFELEKSLGKGFVKDVWFPKFVVL